YRGLDEVILARALDLDLLLGDAAPVGRAGPGVERPRERVAVADLVSAFPDVPREAHGFLEVAHAHERVDREIEPAVRLPAIARSIEERGRLLAALAPLGEAPGVVEHHRVEGEALRLPPRIAEPLAQIRAGLRDAQAALEHAREAVQRHRVR